MLLQTPGSVEKRCGKLWSLATTGGLLALAVVVSGIGLRAEAADDKKDAKEVKIEVVLTPDDKGAGQDAKHKVIVLQSKDGKTITATVPLQPGGKDEKGKKGELPKVAFPDVEDLIKQLPPGLSKDQIEQFRQQMQKAREEMQKAMEQIKRQAPQAGAGARDAIRKAIDEALKDMKGLDKDAAKARRDVLEKALEELRKVDAKDLPGLPPNLRLHSLRALADAAGQGRLGIRVEVPSEALAEQLDLPKGQGLVIAQVVENSAAAKAGMKANDILLSLAGKAVTNDVDALVAIVKDLTAGTPVEAVVLRKGKKETIKGITVAEAPARNRIQLRAAPAGKIQAIPIQPLLPRRQVPGVPGAAKQVTISITRTNDNFTGTYQEGTVTVSASGTVEGGKAKASAIEVKDGDKTTKYDSVDKVPAEHRDKVNKLLEGAGKGGAQIEIKTRTAPALQPKPQVPATTPATPQPKKPAGRDILSLDARTIDSLLPLGAGLRLLAD